MLKKKKKTDKLHDVNVCNGQTCYLESRHDPTRGPVTGQTAGVTACPLGLLSDLD
jgi:hypothetical protein